MFSQTCYFRIEKENPVTYTVKDSYNNVFDLQKEIVRTETDSANHHEEEKKITATEMVTILNDIKE